jgi:hypothetical protein
MSEIDNAEAALDDLMLRGMGPAPEGGWQVELTGAHEVVLAMANSMREMLDEKDATNYVEAYFSAAGEVDGYYLTVRRAHGKSPHALRQEAEARVESLRDALNAYDESCEDKACECCSAWSAHVGAVIDMLDRKGR